MFHNPLQRFTQALKDCIESSSTSLLNIIWKNNFPTNVGPTAFEAWEPSTLYSHLTNSNFNHINIACWVSQHRHAHIRCHAMSICADPVPPPLFRAQQAWSKKTLWLMTTTKYVLCRINNSKTRATIYKIIIKWSVMEIHNGLEDLTVVKPNSLQELNIT